MQAFACWQHQSLEIRVCSEYLSHFHLCEITWLAALHQICQQLGDTQVETITKIQQAVSNNAMDITQNKEWYYHFKDCIPVGSKPNSCGPLPTQNDDVLVTQIRWISIQELADKARICTASVHSILLEDLAMQKVATKSVPKPLMMKLKNSIWESHKYNIPLVFQASYSPDMTPCYLCLFPMLKCCWKEPNSVTRRHEECDSLVVLDFKRVILVMLPTIDHNVNKHSVLKLMDARYWR